MNKEIVMETTHGRANKCKTEFKAVVNKVLVSGVVLATLIGGSGVSALAATPNVVNDYTNLAEVQMNDTISSLRNTINALEELKADGYVSEASLKKLANTINALQVSAVEVDEVSELLDRAEKIIEGVDKDNVGLVKSAIENARSRFGVVAFEDNYSVQQAKSSNISFSDLQGHWGYDNVMELVGMGAINGYEDGTFKPDNSITYAEYLTILVKTTKAGDGNYTAGENEPWYNGVLRAAYESEIVSSGEVSEFSDPITRADAAKFTEKAVQKVLGETAVDTKDMGKLINDYNSFKGKLSEYYILQQYSRGIIQGDDKGNYNPNNNLTRAEASTIILKTVRTDKRADMSKVEIPVSEEKSKFDGTSEDSSPIEIIEGKVERRRFAREGDTVIKADGTRVVLEMVDGILGKNQGVSPDLGVQVASGGNTTVVASNMNDGMVFSGDTDYTDSFGNRVKNQAYYLNRVSGEAHWASEWKVIMANSRPQTDGSFHYQLSEDKNWYWSADYGRWINISAQYISDEGVAKILEANGLN